MTTTLAAKIAREYGTPCAVIDMDKVERNIARIQKACEDAGIANRPHIKTHKNPTIAKAHDELSAAEERWLELEMLREEIEQA